MPNPFVYTSCITDPARFVGRQAELQKIFAALDTLHTGQLQSVSIVGPRRMGRSSLLFHLTQTYAQRVAQPARYVFAYIDLESSDCASLPLLLCHILDKVMAACPDKQHPALAALKAARKAATKDQTLTLAEFEQALSQLAQHPTAPLYPVLCLDEFERLVEHPAQFSEDLYHSWRSLMNNNRASFIVASTRPLPALARTHSLTSPFFNIFALSLPLGAFTEAEAWALVAWGQQCDRPFSAYDCQQMRTLGQNHPLKLQLAGSLIYTAKAAPEVNWAAVRRDFHHAARHIFAPSPHRPHVWPVRLLLALGGFINEIRGHHTPTELSNWIMGLSFIGAVIVLIALIIGRDWLWAMVLLIWLGLKP